MKNDPSKEKNLIPIGKTAEILGVSIDTIRRWDKIGVLHSIRPDGKARHFSLSEIEALKLTKPISIGEAAKKLGISRSTLRRLEKKGLVKPSRNASGERIYDKNSLENFLRGQKVDHKIFTAHRVIPVSRFFWVTTFILIVSLIFILLLLFTVSGP